MPSFGKNENVIIDQGSAWTAEICSSKNSTMLPRADGTGGRGGKPDSFACFFNSGSSGNLVHEMRTFFFSESMTKVGFPRYSSFVGPFRLCSTFPDRPPAGAFMRSASETPYAMLTPSGFSQEIVTSGSAMAFAESAIARTAQRMSGLKSICSLHGQARRLAHFIRRLVERSIFRD